MNASRLSESSQDIRQNQASGQLSIRAPYEDGEYELRLNDRKDLFTPDSQVEFVVDSQFVLNTSGTALSGMGSTGSHTLRAAMMH